MSEEKYELKDGKFSMFKVEQKSKDASPDFTGKGMFLGQEVRLSGWAKTSKDGKVYIQGSLQEPQASAQPATAAQVDSFIGAPTATPDVPQDDLPF